MTKNHSWLASLWQPSFAYRSCSSRSRPCSLAAGGSTPVPARQLVAIRVQPSNGDAVAPSGTIPFVASGTFDQAPTTEDGLAVEWSSSDPSVATIDAASGMASCAAIGGPVTIKASQAPKRVRDADLPEFSSGCHRTLRLCVRQHSLRSVNWILQRIRWRSLPSRPRCRNLSNRTARRQHRHRCVRRGHRHYEDVYSLRRPFCIGKASPKSRA